MTTCRHCSEAIESVPAQTIAGNVWIHSESGSRSCLTQRGNRLSTPIRLAAPGDQVPA